MRLAWIRGSRKINFDRPSTWFTLGVRGSGKSSFIEHIGEQYHAKGHTILDLFGSRDGEGLAWIRHPDIDPESVLLIHGDNVDVSAPVDTISVSDLGLDDFNKYKVLISSSPLYSSPDDEFMQVNKITSLLYQRRSWKNLVYMLAREAANLYYSRVKITQNQTAAKADMIYLIREARHMGVSMGLDTLKYTSIDSDIRAVTDYLIFKAQGIQGLPRDLFWIYKYIDPGKLRVLKPNQFVCLHRGGTLGLGVFQELKWHKQEKEHIAKALGITCDYSEEINYGENKGSFSTLGDHEHIELIGDYLKDKLSMNKIAAKRTYSSGTVYNHINKHNKEVKQSGECSSCMRVGGEFADMLATRR
jgi:hypothetical protein